MILENDCPRVGGAYPQPSALLFHDTLYTIYLHFPRKVMLGYEVQQPADEATDFPRQGPPALNRS